MSTVFTYLDPPDEKLFFSRKDDSDPRMGDLVLRGEANVTDEIAVGIVGVPTDEGVKRNGGRIGAKDGPDAIRAEFYKRTPFVIGKEKSPSSVPVFDFGNIKVGKTLEETHNRLTETVQTLVAAGIVPIVLGGGHDIAYPNFVGFSAGKRNVGVINIDTHLDFRKPIPKRNSGTSFRQMLDHPSSALNAMNFVEVGIQSFANAADHYSELVERGATVFSLRDVRNEGVTKTLDLAYELATASVDSLYISFDMDVVHSADAPGVSAPLPTGFTAEEFLTAALFAGKRRKTKLIDIVELNPKFDIDARTAKLAALAMMYFLTG
ncbi:MAG: formimidoylglutamase, partial [Bacteroidetes bacterium]|nr:formimidoylglutamase [Bacteroidota bacterium]